MTASSALFSEVSLRDAFTVARAELRDSLRTPPAFADLFGRHVIRGVPFLFGDRDGPNVVVLDTEDVEVPLDGRRATYLVIVHVEEDADPAAGPSGGVLPAFGDGTPATARLVPDRPLGATVSDYELRYTDGTTLTVPIRRRFAIQQSHSPAGLACLPAADDEVLLTLNEFLALGLLPEPDRGGGGGTRVWRPPAEFFDGTLWVYALVNTAPDRPLEGLRFRPRGFRSAIYAVTCANVDEHPLRPGLRRKFRLPVPSGIELNKIGEIDQSEIDVDLGVVISARAALDYDPQQWASDAPHVEPTVAQREVLVECDAHPEARLQFGGDSYEPADLRALEISAAQRPVTLRFINKQSRMGVPVRLHLHGETGEYLPPRGHHRKVERGWNEDRFAELATVSNQYAYVDGECVVDLPLGKVYLETASGHEVAPLRTVVSIAPDTDELVFELDRVLDWRGRGWVTADTHVHFLSPQTALLEAKAEDVNVVNLLASQWGELFTNVGDFDGATTVGANPFTGVGEFLVRVGSENRMGVLGHISLLGYEGPLIQPLGSAGPVEAAFGDPLVVTLAEWARQCRDQGGLVVLPHAQFRSIEHAADVAMGLIDAVEVINFNPLVQQPGYLKMRAVDPFALASWYRYLNAGFRVPLVAGSDKMSAEMLLGGLRTYAHVGDRELTYEHWMDAVRQGNTFVTIGPLIEFSVDGTPAGSRVHLPRGGGQLYVGWKVESLCVRIDAVEVVVGGVVEHESTSAGVLSTSGETQIRVTSSTWIAVRVRGGYHGRSGDIAAHTSAVEVLVDGEPILSAVDASEMLDEIQGAVAYVDTIAPRADRRRYLRLRETLTDAYSRLHRRMHAAGIFHDHVLHDIGLPHEH